MDPVAASHAAVLSLNRSLIRRALDGLSGDEVRRRPSEQSNSMLWIAAHLAAMRAGTVVMLGGTIERPAWAALFARGSAAESAEPYPPVEDVLAALDAATAVLEPLLSSLTVEQWAAPSPRKFPIADPSTRGALAFVQFHETYHVGQLAYLRKWLGHSALVG